MCEPFFVDSKGTSASAGTNNNGLDESGVFADLIPTEAVCLDMLGGQTASNANSLTMYQFNDTRSTSDPAPGKMHCLLKRKKD